MLYIMGTARSGSTILEILLAHGARCVGVGELTAIVQDGFIDNKLCSCGRAFSDCEFWSQVAARVAFSRAECETWAVLQKKIDWHAGFLRQLFGLIRAADIERYRSYNEKLLAAIREVSGAEIIVDSSKYAGRAQALSAIDAIELSTICLTRSPAGLLASFQKPNRDEQHPKKPWAVLRYYAFVILSLRIATARLRGGLYRLRYEDLLEKPECTIDEMSRVFAVDFSRVRGKLKAGEGFAVGHLVTGNRLRKSKQVRLTGELDDARSRIARAQVPLILMSAIEKLLGYKR